MTSGELRCYPANRRAPAPHLPTGIFSPEGRRVPNRSAALNLTTMPPLPSGERAGVRGRAERHAEDRDKRKKPEQLPLRPLVIPPRLIATPAIRHIAPATLPIASLILEQPIAGRAVTQPLVIRGRHQLRGIEQDGRQGF